MEMRGGFSRPPPHGLLPAASQTQRAGPSGAPGAPAMRIPTQRSHPARRGRRQAWPPRPSPSARRGGRGAARTGAPARPPPQNRLEDCGRGARASLLPSFPALCPPAPRAVPARGPPSPPPNPGAGTGGPPSRCSEGLKNNRHELLSRQVPPPPEEPPRRPRQVSGAGLGHTSGPASPAGAAGAVLQAAPRLGAVLGAGGGGRRPMGGAAGGAGSGLRPCPAGPPREVSGRRPPSASRRLPPERRRGARRERPGRRGRPR